MGKFDNVIEIWNIKMYFLLLIDEGFEEMAYLSFQVLLEEQNQDVITASPVEGICRGEQDTSVMTISYESVLNNLVDYFGIIIICGNIELNSDMWHMIRKHAEKGGLILGINSGVKLLKTMFPNTDLSDGVEIVHDGNIYSIFRTKRIETIAEKLIAEFISLIEKP